MNITLSLPPPINSTYAVAGSRFYKRSEAIQWMNDMHYILFKKYHRFNTMKGNVFVGITMYLKRDRDIDSSIKMTLDLFQKAGLYANDKQVVFLNVQKQKDLENPRMEINIEPYT